MSFTNPLLLIGLAAALLPVIIHLLSRRRAQDIDWGAMHFLIGSVVSRNRHVLIEEMLLLMVRCALLGLLAVGMALPFVPADAGARWLIILPAMMLGVALIGAGVAVWRIPRWRWTLLTLAATLIVCGVALSMIESGRQSERWKSAGAGDVVIVIDASASMTAADGGTTAFERAIGEARAAIESLGPDDSVGVILAGPQPRRLVSLTQAGEPAINAALNDALAIGGPMDTREALELARRMLADGANPQKTILLISDAQRTAFGPEGSPEFDGLGEVLAAMSPPPRLILRRLPMPRELRNVQIADLSLSRATIGPDRPVTIGVTVANTGKRVIGTPFDAELRIDGGARTYRHRLDRLEPGASHTFSFAHRFDRAGSHVVEARVLLDDDLPADNGSATVVRVVSHLPVLVIEGSPAPRPADRAAVFLRAALAAAGDTAADDKGGAAPAAPLLNVDAVEAAGFADEPFFPRYRAVILADVPKMPTVSAIKLAQYLADGGSVFIVAGPNAQPDFYNEWRTAQGQRITPASLVEWVQRPASEPASPAADRLGHPALRQIVENRGSDFTAARIEGYWRLDTAASGRTGQVGASLDSGEPLLIEQAVGSGRVVMIGIALDRRSGDLPIRQSFAPFIVELVQGLVGADSIDSPLQPRDAATIRLTPHDGVESRATADIRLRGRGLRADYFATTAFRSRLVSTVDASLQMDWQNNSPAQGVPADGFSVRWTGAITAPKDGMYSFELAGDDRAELWIDGRLIVASTAGAAQRGAPIELQAGEPRSIRVELVDELGTASCMLWWSTEGIERQAIAAERLSPVEPWLQRLPEWREGLPAPTEASNTVATLTGPDGRKRLVAMAADGGRVVATADLAQSGLYQLALPEAMAHAFRDRMVGASIPIAVASRPEEGRLIALSEDELAQAAAAIDLRVVDDTTQMRRAIIGETPGRRLWWVFALAALALVLAEVALTRWIACQRRVNESDLTDLKPTLARRDLAPPPEQRRRKRAAAEPVSTHA